MPNASHTQHDMRGAGQKTPRWPVPPDVAWPPRSRPCGLRGAPPQRASYRRTGCPRPPRLRHPVEALASRRPQCRRAQGIPGPALAQAIFPPLIPSHRGKAPLCTSAPKDAHRLRPWMRLLWRHGCIGRRTHGGASQPICPGSGPGHDDWAISYTKHDRAPSVWFNHGAPAVHHPR